MENPVPPLYHLPRQSRRLWWKPLLAVFVCLLVVLSVASLPLLWFAVTGGCDPECHILVTNHYAVPVVIHHLANPEAHLPAQTLDTVPPGQRKELATYAGLDGDIDHLQVEDTQRHVLARLNSKAKNVVDRQSTRAYIWEISVGP